MGNVVSFKDASSLLKRLGFLAVSTDGSHTRFLGPITVTLVKEHEGSEEMGVSRDMLEILKHLSLLDDRGNVTAHVIVRS
jgi:predicted RNA binding protein YcfA (HicA-like mRNA interferase family)